MYSRRRQKPKSAWASSRVTSREDRVPSAARVRGRVLPLYTDSCDHVTLAVAVAPSRTKCRETQMVVDPLREVWRYTQNTLAFSERARAKF